MKKTPDNKNNNNGRRTDNRFDKRNRDGNKLQQIVKKELADFASTKLNTSISKMKKDY